VHTFLSTLRPRTTSPTKDALLREFALELLQQGVIENASSDWNSCPHLVKKPGIPPDADPCDKKTWRFVVDFVKLNSRTKPLASLLPKTEEMMATLHGCRVLSKLDLKSAYHQLLIPKGDRHKTAFRIPGLGYFQYRGLAMGLRNAVVVFHEYLTKLLRDIPGVTVYLDDILIATVDTASHRAALHEAREVLRRLSEAGLIASADKTFLFRNSVPFMGFSVTARGVELDPRRKAELRELSPPHNTKTLRSVLGILNFLRGYMVKEASDCVTRLQDLAKAPGGFKRSDESDTCFRRIIE
jgi:hypothetical protein